ncbi:MAG: tyrosine-type recombinase/integrase [Lachnospiraceae bacterium]|nr:tyrosine-type recombinase/integrase [Lachnospiraceae bacterium]
MCEKILLELENYREYLITNEKSLATINKYCHEIYDFYEYIGSSDITKETIIKYKTHLLNDPKYKISTVNTKIIALNSYLKYKEMEKFCIKTIRIQSDSFIPEQMHLTKEEYNQLLRKALEEDKIRLYLVMKTLCTTGIRISELRFFTYENVESGMIEIYLKGKFRRIIIPDKLKSMLLKYCKENKITAGEIFLTKNKRPLDRSNLWRSLKKLADDAGIPRSNVFPHNFRHLFGQDYFYKTKAITRLGDVLGHSSIETTRIYLKTTSIAQKECIEKLDL